MFLCVCITQYGLYVYMKYIDLYEDITEIDELKQCLRQNKTGTGNFICPTKKKAQNVS